MKQMSWPELKEKILNLNLKDQPVQITMSHSVVDEALFIKSHIAVIESVPNKRLMTSREKSFRFYVAKPHYDRLLAYYILKTQL